MSTNTNPNDLPDVAHLQELANQFFRSLPNSQAAGVELPGSNESSPTSLAGLVAENPFQNHLIDPQAIHYNPAPVSLTPPSAVGTGIASPSVPGANFSSFNSDHSAGYPGNQATNVPKSYTGSGASPSSVSHGNNVNIEYPQTSLPDQTLEAGVIPESQGGKGQTTNSGLHYKLPFEGDSSFPGELEKILAGIITPSYDLQIPGFNESAVSDLEQYYFLDNRVGSRVVSEPASQKKRYGLSSSSLGLDAYHVKKDFPILNETVNGKRLIWLDNAATTQKPRQVIDRISYFYEHENSNIHRAAHELAARATDAYEGARGKIQKFLNAASPNEIVFVRGTTEAINLVAKSWGEQNLKAGDEIIVSHLEHHANIVPWQQLVARKNLKLRVIPVDDQGQIILEEYAKLLNPNTKLVAFTQVSNALGTITPAAAIIQMAKSVGAKVLLDGAQSVSHIRTDVQALNPDWFVFSGHKIFGPTGIGVLYGKEALLNSTEPWQGGGNMIRDVTFEHTQYHAAPSRFEAGTGNIADAVGLGAAIDYVTKLGIDSIFHYEHLLLEYATNLLNDIPGLKLIGTAKEKTSVLSFTLDGYTNDEVGQALNRDGIAVRTGHHCAQPILRRFGLESTVRPSLAFYNTCEDVDDLVASIRKLRKAK